MASLVRISEAASIALHACLWMARDEAAYCRSTHICAALGFSEAHFAKVMQSLARAGLVVSARGPAGGTRLARPADDITLLQVYEAVDGATASDRCLLASAVCPEACCKLGRTLARHNEALRHRFAATTLAGLARAFKAGTGRPGAARAAERTGGKRRVA